MTSWLTEAWCFHQHQISTLCVEEARLHALCGCPHASVTACGHPDNVSTLMQREVHKVCWEVQPGTAGVSKQTAYVTGPGGNMVRVSVIQVQYVCCLFAGGPQCQAAITTRPICTSRCINM